MSDHPPLGKLIDGKQQRDAIHIAIAPVTATQRLAPGEHIGFVTPGDTDKVGPSLAATGIVDPFLTAPVFKGERFWMFLYPQTITSLRHDWTHLAFASFNPAKEATAEASKVWLMEFADRHYAAFKDLIYSAEECAKTGSAYLPGASESFDIPTEFWRHYEIFTGKKPPADREGAYFSCSC